MSRSTYPEQPNAMGIYPMTAVEWVIGPYDDFAAGISEVRVVRRGQRDGSTLFAVTMRGWTANRDAEWELEPIPSSRDDDYLARCRWDDWEDAALIANRMVRKEREQWEARFQ